MIDPVHRLVYCWDSTIYLAWLNEESGAPLADIEIVAKEIDANQAALVVPVTIASEVISSKLSDDQRDKMTKFLQRSNVLIAVTTIDIATKAGGIRGAGLAMNPKRKIKTPDAQIIATAIIYKVSALHSLDDGMLQLNGLAAVEGLQICKPISKTGQRGLSF